jgi:AraC family transcriptional regulator
MLRESGNHWEGGAAAAWVARDLDVAVADLLVNAREILERDRAVARSYVERAAALLGDRPAPEPADNRVQALIPRGGLAPWQSKRVQAYVAENLSLPIAIEELAALCRLSTSHFSRAFKVSFGEPPHGYIVRRRIEEAKRSMEETEEPLSQIAAACGFADQSHFCRHFRRSEGTSPSLWRRARAMDPGLAAAE